MQDTDALSRLRRAKFRGQEFPILGAAADHAWENAEHGILFRDGQILETTGGRNWTFTYTIPFRQGLAKGQWENLFTVGLPRFLQLYREGLEGELVDPVYGSWIVKPGRWSSRIEAAKRDGIDAEVSFIESPPIEATLPQEIPSPATVESAAGRLDEAVQVVTWEQDIPGEMRPDALSAIAGVGAQLQSAQYRTKARMDGIADRADAVCGQAEQLRDGGERSEMLAQSSRVRLLAARASGRRAEPGRTAVLVSVRFPMSLTTLSKNLGMTLERLLMLNPGLAKTPMVQAGTEVWKS